ncbi:MAG: hypothetical protein HW394_926, partial [Acidobacteria bacterium]|nr:hypothetical protein [Acidobacteriota bacterium]
AFYVEFIEFDGVSVDLRERELLAQPVSLPLVRAAPRMSQCSVRCSANLGTGASEHLSTRSCPHRPEA